MIHTNHHATEESCNISDDFSYNQEDNFLDDNMFSNDQRLSSLNHNNLQSLKKDMDSIQQKLSNLTTSNTSSHYSKMLQNKIPLEQRLKNTQILLDSNTTDLN